LAVLEVRLKQQTKIENWGSVSVLNEVIRNAKKDIKEMEGE
jgi:hypothetical protein